LSIFTQTLATGCTLTIPPTIPTERGISKIPTKSPLSFLLKLLSDLYFPEIAAYAFAAASIALLS
jgi:hypothetical protein